MTDFKSQINTNIHESAQIHESAIISANAHIGKDVVVGPFSIIGENVTLDEGCVLHSHVVIKRNSKIGKNNEFFQFASIGEDCQDLKFVAGEDTWLEIGDNNTFRESCTVHRGTTQDNSITKIGNKNLFMVNAHVAHDVIVGDNNVIANNVAIAGHVHIGNANIIGGNSAIHQFCKINSFCMIGGGSIILKDVAAYTTAAGNPAAARGFNVEGMRRRGWSKETIEVLREASQVIFKTAATVADALEILENELLPKEPKIQLLVDSLKTSTRGITR